MYRPPLFKTGLGYQEGEASKSNDTQLNERHLKNIDQTFIASSSSSHEDLKQEEHQDKHVHFNNSQSNSRKENNARNQNDEKGSTSRNDVGKTINIVHHKASTRNNGTCVGCQQLNVEQQGNMTPPRSILKG